MKEFAAYLAAAMAGVALVFVLKDIVVGRAVQRDPGAWIAVMAVVLGGLFYEARIIPPGQTSQISFLTALLACLLMSIVRSRRDGYSARSAKVAAAVFLPAGVSFTLFLTNALMNPGLPLLQSFGRLLSVAIVLLLAFIFVSGTLSLADVCRIIVSSVLVIVLISPLIGKAWRACDIFKCGPFGAIYTGPFSSENAFAIYACVAILSLQLMESKRTAFAAMLPLVLVLYATESRTSQIALGCAFIAVILLKLWNASRTTEGMPGNANSLRISSGQVHFFGGVTVLIAVLGYYLIAHAEPSSFSNRGGIWIRGMAALGGDWVLGLGLDRWTFLQTIGLLPPLFPHSEYLLLLFGGGLVGVALMLLTLVASIAKSGLLDAPFAIGFTIFLAVLGLTEAYWNPATFDGHTMLVVPLMVLLSQRTDLVSGRELRGELVGDFERSSLVNANRGGARSANPAGPERSRRKTPGTKFATKTEKDVPWQPAGRQE